MRNPFDGKVAIVTGGASGIGKALCEELCRRGAHVVVADLDVERAEELVAALTARGARAQAVRLDVTDRELVHQVVTDAAAEHGRLDYMFNNAAAPWSRTELRDHPLRAWDQSVDVNLNGVLYGTLAAYEVMARQGSGHIVNTSSIAGLIGYPTSIHYGATKAAVVNLSYSLRMEAEAFGVHVSVVCPGPVHGKSKYFFKMIGADGAAREILDGVARRKAIIVFPWVARALWLLYRLSPGLLFPLGRKLVRQFREKQPAPAEVPAAPAWPAGSRVQRRRRAAA